MHRLHILTIPRQWGSVFVSRRSKTLLRTYYSALYRSGPHPASADFALTVPVEDFSNMSQRE
jgi:hypothetical protein